MYWGCIARIPVNPMLVGHKLSKGFNWLHRQNTGQRVEVYSAGLWMFQLAASPEYRSTIMSLFDRYTVVVSIGCIARIPVNKIRFVMDGNTCFNWLHRQNTGQPHKWAIVAQNPFQLAASPEYRSTPSPIFYLYFSVSYKRYFPYKKNGRKITVLA